MPAECVFSRTGEVYQLSCLEIRGGNRFAVYSAELPGWSAWVASRPLNPAAPGGDLHYLSVCSHGAISRAIVADVEGHGEDVSAVAERLRDALRQHASEWDQSALVRTLNDGFLHGTSQGKFATAFVLSHYAATGEALFTNAGHLPPLWHRNGSSEWTLLDDETSDSTSIADLPLGMISGTDYTQTAVRFAAGDSIVLYTDGISEARNSRGEQLGQDGLLEIASGLPNGSPSATGEALLTAVEGFRGAVPAADDATVVVLQCKPRT